MDEQIRNSIKDVEIVAKKVFNPLNRFKRWVCRVLKITPLLLYEWEIRFTTELPANLKADYIVIADDSSKWLITMIGRSFVYAKSIFPKSEINLQGRSFYVVGSVAVETEPDDKSK